ncbi:TetR/AcrR family transcriptional regulator [Nonomuraea sp. NN258]|uniref:TetR/AcrR family transcriptional regulator n=1 Tax=Nonomuraea antri TaxID=2730852 RepID=UPI001567EDD4|nr:TetR/AcrR family transcriptional regulator [Nonomuraea antri]NRQ31727.1 TetR/AcrR family transcriptional regulator [Nonomuraea antri]
MGPTKVERAGTRTRQALLDAALAVFTERTYGDTAVAAVAELAGVSVGTLYRHFPSKEALGNAVYRHWKSRLLDRLAESSAGDEPARVTFGRLWAALREFAVEHPDAFAFLEFQQHEIYLDADSRMLSTRLETLGLELVTRGQRTGEIRKGEPAVLLALLNGAFVGLFKAVSGGLRLDAEQFEAAEEATWGLLAKG